MTHTRTPTKLNKRYVTTHEGWAVYAVNAYAVRDVAQPDEEFGNFATVREFPSLIPKGEIWIADRNVEEEGIFFIADALMRQKECERGVPEERAYTAGLNVERTLRERLTGLKFRAGRPHKRVPRSVYVDHYFTIPDEKFPVNVWVADGRVIRSLYKTDYTEGGHGYVYPWVPKGEIWVEKALDRRELPFIVTHEYLELRLMRDRGVDYDRAHEICAKVEFQMRKNDPVKLYLAPGRRKVAKPDLRRLPSPELFDYVTAHYLKNR